MTSERWERTNQILDDVLKLAPEKRAAYLDSACGGDAELRGEVEPLIASLEEAGTGFLVVAAPQVLDVTVGGQAGDEVALRKKGRVSILDRQRNDLFGSDAQQRDGVAVRVGLRGSGHFIIIHETSAARRTKRRTALRIRFGPLLAPEGF